LKKGILIGLTPLVFLIGCGGSSGTKDTKQKTIVYSINTDISDGGSISPTQMTVQSQTSATFTLTPDTDYQIGQVSGCSGTVQNNEFIIEKISANCLVQANFIPKQIQTFTINTSISEGGTISPSQMEITKNSSATFIVTNNTGFNLVDISGCEGVINNNEYHVSNISEDCLISVDFTKISHAINIESLGGGRVDLPIPNVVYGDTTQLTLVPNSDHIVGTASGCNGNLSNEIYTTGNIYEACTVSVNFDSLLPLPEAPLERIRIPVVVHVLENEWFNISDEKIISQIQATNLHYRKQNLPELTVIKDNHQPYIADTGIQFYLADRDPNGEPHNGIVRLNSTASAFSYDFNFAIPEQGGSEPWPNDKYINIWIGYSKDRWGRLGIAGRAHIPTLTPDQYIGVSIAQSVFGTTEIDNLGYEQGKTLTHELGHFLGLIGHTDGDNFDQNTHALLPCSNLVITDCKNTDLNYNFMRSYTNDLGMRMFSQSQQDMMRDWLEVGPLQALYLNNL